MFKKYVSNYTAIDSRFERVIGAYNFNTLYCAPLWKEVSGGRICIYTKVKGEREPHLIGVFDGNNEHLAWSDEGIKNLILYSATYDGKDTCTIARELKSLLDYEFMKEL